MTAPWCLINSVGNVGDLGTGGARFTIMESSIWVAVMQSYRRSWHGRSGSSGWRGSGKVDLNAHIAAGNHDVSHSQDLVDVIDAPWFSILAMMDVAVVLVQQVANFHDVLGVAHGWQKSDRSPARYRTEYRWVVAVARVGHGQVHTGDATPFLVLMVPSFLTVQTMSVSLTSSIPSSIRPSSSMIQAASGNVAGSFVGDRADLVMPSTSREVRVNFYGDQLLHAVLEGA